MATNGTRTTKAMKETLATDNTLSVTWLVVGLHTVAVILKGVVEKMHQSGVEADVAWYLELNELIKRLETDFESLR